MTKVFISYSRKDKETAQKLNAALESIGIDAWIDWDDIPPTADWRDQIQKGIESADAFLFLLSPDSVTSVVCNEEIEHAAKNGKRLIPLVVRSVNEKDVHPALARLNWIFFREEDHFSGALKKLEQAVNTDLPWVEAHRRLQIRALDWDKRRDRSLLLRGSDLREAEERLASSGRKDPLPTDLQRQYVLESRRGESRTRNVGVTIGGAVIVALTILSVFAFVQRNDAQEKATIARARELASEAILLRDTSFPVSLLLGVEGFRTNDLPSTRGALLDNAQAHPALVSFIDNYGTQVVDLAYSPDGTALAVVQSGKGTLTIWNVNTTKPLRAPVYAGVSVAFSPDNVTLAYSDGDGAIQFINWTSGESLGESIPPRDSGVSDIAFSPNGKLLVVCYGGNNIIVWDVKTRTKVGEFIIGTEDNVAVIALSPDGKTLASSQYDTVLLWDLETYQPIGVPLGTWGNVWSLAFSPDGKRLAIGSNRSTLDVWDVTTREHTQTIIAEIDHVGAIQSLAFSPDGRTLAAGIGGTESKNFEVLLWDIDANRSSYIAPLTGQSDVIDKLAFSPDGKTLASGSFDGSVAIWNVDEYRKNPIISTISANQNIASIAYSPDGKWMAAGGEDTDIILWDAATHQPVGEPLKGHSGWVTYVEFSADSAKLASIDSSGEVILWGVATHAEMGSPIKNQSAVRIDPNNKLFVTADKDQTGLQFWDLNTLQPIGQPIQQGSGYIFDLAFSPDGTRLVTPQDEFISVWDVNKRKKINSTPNPNLMLLNHFAFSPGGDLLAVGGYANQSGSSSIILWDMKTRSSSGEMFIESQGDISRLMFSPNGKILAAARYAASIELWDTETHQLIGSKLTQSYGVNDISFSPDGKELASIDGTESVYIWNLDPQTWIEISCQRAGRNFTRSEWASYFPDETYRATCPQWPLEEAQTSSVETFTPTSYRPSRTLYVALLVLGSCASMLLVMFSLVFFVLKRIRANR